MKIKKILARPISYGGKRSLKDIRYIVIHYTGNAGDTAQANANYFAHSNIRNAGAHFFVDKKGTVYKSIAMRHTAWSVGGFFTKKDGAGAYYGTCTNANSISIELCDCLKDTNLKQILSTRELVKQIQKKCPGAKTIIRHWDVNGKNCPGPMTGKNNKKWNRLHAFLTKNCQFQAKVSKKAAIRSSGKVTPTNKIGTIMPGKTITIEKISGNWGRLKGRDARGRSRWITLSKLTDM